MALARVNTGDPGVASNVDQFVDLLTGTMTDQQVTLAHSQVPLRISRNDGVQMFQFRADDNNGDPGCPWMRSDNNFLVLNPRPGSDLYLHWDGGSGSTHIGPTSAVTLYVGEGNGPVHCGAITSSGSISGTTGTFSSNVTGNGNRLVEGTAAATHVEAFHDSSGTAVGGGLSTTRSFTFARAFSSLPAVAASCMNGGADQGNVTTKCLSLSTTSVTFGFKNTDPNTQTLNNFSIVAIGN